MQYKSIWNKSLHPSEEVKYEFSVGNFYRKFCMVFIGLVGLLSGIFFSWWIGGLLILIALFKYGFYEKAAHAYAFTNNRVLSHIGWLSTTMVSTEYNKITDVTVKEDILDKVLFRVGTLAINTAGRSGEEIVLRNIEHPYEIKKKLDSLRGNL